MKKAKVLILETDGSIDSKEYDTFEMAEYAFRNVAHLLIGDAYQRVVRLLDEQGKVRGNFDSLTGSWSIRI
jgi:hypothetical protein